MPPVNMRLIARTEAPSEDTPPSTRPSSAASNSTSNSGPQRSTSMDSIHTSSSLPEKQGGEEIIPTRFTRSSPRVNVNASMQFVKTKPAALYKSARDQIQKAEDVKTLRKISLLEEEDYQANLDKWKNTRRKRNEDILERVIESKKFEEEDCTRGRRKSKTFSEMRQEKDKRGRRYNLVVHNDDNDLSDLGLTPSTKSSVEEQPEEADSKEVDNKDTKSDAGFCTGSDTGSDGVFAEDNISDTSSALGDKKETMELLPEPPPLEKPREMNGISELPTVKTLPEPISKVKEFTFDKAIEQYKEFTERSKKKSTSMSNLSPRVVKDDSPKVSSQNKLQEKLGYFSGELAREERIVPKMRTKNKGKMQKVDIKKRRSMFELRDCEDKSDPKKPVEMSKSLRNKVTSFEKQDNVVKSSSIIPQRDINFKEKLASFNQKNYCETNFSKKVLQNDQNFYQKIHTFSKKQQPCAESKSPLVQPTSLKQRIASFEKGSPDRTKSASTECLSKIDNIEKNYSSPITDGLKKFPSTPFLVIDDENESESVLFAQLQTQPKSVESNNRKTVYEQVDKCEVKRDTDSAPMYSIFSQNGSQNSEQKLNGIPLRDLSDVKFSGTYLVMNGGLAKDSVDDKTSGPLLHISDKDIDEKLIPPRKDLSIPAAFDAELEFDSLEAKDVYGDDDIDEVIQVYENIKPPNIPTSNATTYFLSNESFSMEDDTYERMDNQAMNENIYEQLDESSVLANKTLHSNQTYEFINDSTLPLDHSYQSLANKTLRNDHTYQSLEELREQLEMCTPPLPPKKSDLTLEVLDVSWTEDSGRSNQAIPPSVPPPPPPVEDEEGYVVGGGVVSGTETSYVSCAPDSVDVSSCTENLQHKSESDSRRSNIMTRSQFLGVTTPFVSEEVSAKPPPDMKEFIRQERDSERQLIQNKSKKPENDLDFITPSRFKFTWKDRMREDSSNDVDDTSSHLEFQYKLAQLELEMEEHDRDMLQRVTSTEDVPCEPIVKRTTVAHSTVMANDKEDKPLSQLDKKAATNTKSLPVQEFYSAPVYENKTTPTNNFGFINKNNAQKDSALRKNQSQIPALNNVQPPPKPSRTLSEVNIQSHKPNIKALSAIPKPKRVENDSWIAKKKSDSSKRNYNSHWLIQEAEQRRLDSLARQTSVPVLPFRPANLLPAPISYNPSPQPQPCLTSPSVVTNKPQSKKSGIQYFGNSVYSSDTSNIYANTSNYSNPSSNSSSENINCKMKGVTYNPQKPSPPQKPLPASIISTITQRVSNKGRTNSNDRPVMYNSRINNHDYMNSETIEAIRSQNDVTTPPLTVNLINTRHTAASMRNSMQNSPPADMSSPSAEDQRLLSVSGKKKCSHCCDELGRGAAMIIESLRLFYHIPCFKCCVCGTQLGNGTAGADVRVRNHKLHCHNCYSNDEGMKFSKV